MNHPRIHIIAAIGKDTRVLGKNNTLLWHISEDLKRFKTLTMGHPIIMGRKTFESIGKPLPGRTNIVITRNPSFTAAGIVIVHSLNEALIKGSKLDTDVFVIGGGEIYEETLPYADILHLTLVETNTDGDVFFPPWENFTRKTFSETHRDSTSGLVFEWAEYEKNKSQP